MGEYIFKFGGDPENPNPYRGEAIESTILTYTAIAAARRRERLQYTTGDASDRAILQKPLVFGNAPALYALEKQLEDGDVPTVKKDSIDFILKILPRQETELVRTMDNRLRYTQPHFYAASEAFFAETSGNNEPHTYALQLGRALTFRAIEVAGNIKWAEMMGHPGEDRAF